MISRRLTLLYALVFAAFMAGLSARAAEQWILIDTGARTLTVMREREPVVVFDNISVGRNGTTHTKMRHDNRTPLGVYRVSGVRENSRFHRFFTIDYPSLEDAQEALDSGRISEAAFRAIRSAHEHGEQPPATTPLGGYIGIHGIGDGDPRIHEDYDWTDGCIALRDEQIDELTPLITEGMTVVIR